MGEGSAHSISDYGNTFFTYQDYYVPSSSDNDPDWEVTVSLQQKFYERNTLDVVLEVLATDIAQSEIDTSKYPARPIARRDRASLFDVRRRDNAGSQMALGS